MYGIYNSETLEKLINTVHKMHDIMTPNKKLWDRPLFNKFPPICENSQKNMFKCIKNLSASYVSMKM